MRSACIRDKHISLRDEKAPYRGTWMIGSDPDGRYWALHDTSASTGALEVVEERSFEERSDASRFVRHLVLHGWSVYEFASNPVATELLG